MQHKLLPVVRRLSQAVPILQSWPARSSNVTSTATTGWWGSLQKGEQTSVRDYTRKPLSQIRGIANAVREQALYGSEEDGEASIQAEQARRVAEMAAAQTFARKPVESALQTLKQGPRLGASQGCGTSPKQGALVDKSKVEQELDKTNVLLEKIRRHMSLSTAEKPANMLIDTFG
eukprot:133852-Prorocentrum_minimum.AAC.4